MLVPHVGKGMEELTLLSVIHFLLILLLLKSDFILARAHMVSKDV